MLGNYKLVAGPRASDAMLRTFSALAKNGILLHANTAESPTSPELHQTSIMLIFTFLYKFIVTIQANDRN